jgi:hypothetical protein
MYSCLQNIKNVRETHGSFFKASEFLRWPNGALVTLCLQYIALYLPQIVDAQ